MTSETSTTFSVKNILLFCLIVLVPLLWNTESIDPNEHIQFLGLSTVLTLFWFQFIQKKIGFSVKNKNVLLLFISWAAFVLYSLVSMFRGLNISESIFMELKYVLFGLTALTVFYHQKNNNDFTRIARLFVLTNLISSLPAFFQLIELINTQELIIPKSTYIIKSVFAHRNLLVETLILTIPFCIYTVFTDTSLWKKIALSSLSTSIFLIVLLSNRTAWLCLSIVLFATAIFIFLYRKNLLKELSFKGLIILFLVSSSLGFIVLNVYSNKESLETHALNSLDITQGSTKDRIELWKRTIHIIEENPILGTGLDDWKIDMLAYGTEGLVSEDNVTFYQRPHNDFLWVLSEQGIIGLILYLSFFLILIYLIIKKISAKTDSNELFKLLLIGSVLLMYLIIAQLNFPKERIGHNIILFTSIGLFLSLFENGQAKISKFDNIKFGILFILLSCLSIGFLRYSKDKHLKNAILLKSQSQFSNCLTELDLATSFFYVMDETSTPIDWYRGLSNYNLKKYNLAKDNFENALKINPFHIHNLNDYASCLAKLGDENLAIEYYKKAIEISPNYLDAKLNLAALYYISKDWDNAFELLKTTNPRSKNPRYQKTLQVILKQIFSNEIKSNHASEDFIALFSKENKQYLFYQRQLQKAIKGNLTFHELINPVTK